jgi:hypothetical protein
LRKLREELSLLNFMKINESVVVVTPSRLPHTLTLLTFSTNLMVGISSETNHPYWLRFLVDFRSNLSLYAPKFGILTASLNRLRNSASKIIPSTLRITVLTALSWHTLPSFVIPVLNTFTSTSRSFRFFFLLDFLRKIWMHLSSHYAFYMPTHFSLIIVFTLIVFSEDWKLWALCYKPESHGFDFRFFQSHYGPGVDWASNRNEYQESS